MVSASTASEDTLTNSSSSWITMNTLPSFDSDEHSSTPTRTSPVENSVEDENILPADPPKSLISEEEAGETEMLEVNVMPNESMCTQDSMMFFDIVEKSAQLLKSGSAGQLVSILGRTVSLFENRDAEEIDALCGIMDILLENLEESGVEYLRYLKTHLNDVTLPKAVRKFYVEKDMIQCHYVLLGNGGFGEVTKGHLSKPGAPIVSVAVKQAKSERFNGMFLEEASVMAQLDHDVILKLLAVTHDRGIVQLAVEFMESGDLVDAIIMERIRLSTSDLLVIIHDVASGMEYLSNKQYIHRDLKCANVFINSKKECKIGDFGLCKYVGDTGGVYQDTKLRLNSTHVAPEAKATNQFTTKSDVWAMGILVWELYSVRKAYSNTRNILKCLYATEQMWRVFLFRGHLLQVQDCPTELHNYLVREVLHNDPTQRPSFENIKEKIIEVIKKNHNYVAWPQLKM
ncbi:ephrin type-A receptor 4a-like isoform X2 [Anoplophora glabripennis]|nr:ephrin type-A receptor 4a-like isoform X2 [Anoplophora glabripennis]